MVEIIVIAVFIIVLAAAFTGLFGTMLKSKGPKNDSQENIRVNSEQVINKAKNLYETGQLSKAIKLLDDFTKKMPDEVNVRFLLAEYLMEKTLPLKAEKHYRHLLKLLPDNTDANERAADCYFIIGKFDKALQGYKTILKKHPDEFPVREKLADTYVKVDNTEQAIIEYRTILSKDHYNAQVMRKLADLFFSKGEYSRAIQEYENIIKIDGVKANILKRIAKANCCLNKFVDAALAYRKIIDLDENDEASYKELADIYIQMQSYEKAARVYSLMIEKGLNVSPPMLIKLAEIYLLIEDYERAISLGNKIFAENPDQVNVLEIIAEAYKKLGRFENAISAYQKLIEETGDQAKINSSRHNISVVLCDWGNEFYKTKDYQAALDKLVEAIQHDDTNPEVFFSLGKVNSMVKNPEAGISHFHKAIELSGYDAEMYEAIAMAYDELGQTDSAVELCYDAVKRYPDSYELRTTLARILIKEKYYDQAEGELLTAINNHPERPEGHYNLGVVYEKLKRAEEARASYQKALDMDPDFEPSRQKLQGL